MENKICNCCKIEKTIEDYHNNKRFPDGKNPTCKECNKERSLKYYYNNIDKIKESTKTQRETEDYQKYRKNYLENNREEINRKYWKLAGLRRNEQMAQNADALILFNLGTSGSQNMLYNARKLGLKIREIKI